MRFAMIGLGKMGANMTTRRLRGGHQVVAYDVNDSAVQKAAAGGAEGATSLKEVAAKLSPPRVAWLMVAAGDVTEKTVSDAAGVLSPEDIVVDGGNSYYKDSMRRGSMLAEKKLHFVDVGTSGGVWGLTEG